MLPTSSAIQTEESSCAPNLYSLKCLTETVNSLSDLPVSHIGSSGSIPPPDPQASVLNKTIDGEDQPSSEFSDLDSASKPIPRDYVKIKSPSAATNTASKCGHPDRGTFFMISALDSFSSSPNTLSDSEPISTSQHPSTSLTHMRHVSVDSVEAGLDETLPPSGSLNLPHLEDGLSSAEEGEFVTDDEDEECTHENPFYPEKSSSTQPPNGSHVSADSGLLSRKLMEDITQDIKEIKRAIVDSRDLPPVIARTPSVSSPSTKIPPLLERGEQTPQDFAQFRYAFPTSPQDAEHHNESSPQVAFVDQRQSHMLPSSEPFHAQANVVSHSATSSTAFNVPPNHIEKHSGTTRSHVINHLGLPLRPLNAVHTQKEGSISPHMHGDSNSWSYSNHFPSNVRPSNASNVPVVNHRPRLHTTPPTSTSSSNTRHKVSTNRKNHAASSLGEEKALEAQHWTFPNVSHTLYSSSSSGGEMDDDLESGSEDHSGIEDDHLSHMPSSCTSTRCLSNPNGPTVANTSDMLHARDCGTNTSGNHLGVGQVKPPPPSSSSQSSHLASKHANGPSQTTSSYGRPFHQADKLSGIPPPETVDYESDEDTAKLLNRPYQKEQSMDIPELREERELQCAKQRRGREVAVRHPERPSHLIEGALFRVMYLGSTQLFCDSQPSKATRLLQAQEAVGRIKVPENEFQPCTPVDLFVSTEKLIVLNTNLREIVMDYALRTISYIADIGDVLVLMARPTSLPSPNVSNDMDKSTQATSPVTTSSSDSGGSSLEDEIRKEGCPQSYQGGMTSPRSLHQNKIVCHVFESGEAQMIAQCIGKAFQAAYIEFLRANGIDDPNMFKEMDYQEVLNQQELYGDELHMFANREMQKEIVIPKHQGEALGVVIVESGWGSMVPTVMLANMNSTGPAARCGLLNIGNQIISVNGNSVVGLPLSMCQQIIKNCRPLTAVKLSIVCSSPVVEVLIRRPDAKYQLGFSVQNGVICSLLRGGIAERGGIRVGHRIIEINGQSVVAVPHERIVHLLATAVGEIHLRTMPTSIFRLLTGQETPHFI